MKLLYIFEWYPALTQTFLRREITGLRQHGFDVEIESLFRHRDVAAVALPDVPVRYFRWWEALGLIVALPRELIRDPALVKQTWRLVCDHFPTNPDNFFSSLWAAIYGICRANALRRRRPDAIHGVWATAPATAAAVLARLCDLPFSFGAQAYDVYRHGGDAFLVPKMRTASFVHTTTQYNVAHLSQRAPGANIILARRGVMELPVLADTPRPPGPLRILSVGRLVPMKGHELQLAACAALQQRGIDFTARIVGGGSLAGQLQRTIDRLGLRDRVTLRGALPPAQVAEEYRWADLFWHTGIVDAEGNRDGLPNVIPEAFAYGLPVISSDAGSAAEAAAAVVVPAGDEAALIAAADRLARDAALRRELSAAGRQWVKDHFLVANNTAILAKAFREARR